MRAADSAADVSGGREQRVGNFSCSRRVFRGDYRDHDGDSDRDCDDDRDDLSRSFGSQRNDDDHDNDRDCDCDNDRGNDCKGNYGSIHVGQKPFVGLLPGCDE